VTAPTRRRAPVEERRARILEVLQETGRADVRPLAVALDVTEETIRRDLRALHDAGLLRRAHGGALRADPVPSGAADDGRAALVARAAGLPADGASVLLGAGPVSEGVATALSRRGGVRLLTTSVPVALAAVLADPDADVHLIGGGVRSDGAATGPWATEQLSGIRVDVVFLEADGLSADARLMSTDPERAAVEAAAVEAAETVVLLAEPAGLVPRGLVRYAGLGVVHRMLVRADATDEALAALHASGVPVEVVPVGAGVAGVVQEGAA
jgi:DeoR family fructose operon transcriptional repressor